MGHKRPPTAADLELANYVTAHEENLSARMVRTHRADRLIAKAVLIPQGYAQPVLSVNPPEAFDQALAVARVRAGKRISFSDLAFGLFDQEYALDIVALRRAYQDHFTAIMAYLRNLADGDDDLALAEEIARQALKRLRSTKQGRFMARQARRVAKENGGPGALAVVSEEAMLTETLTVLSMVMLGRDLGQLDHADDKDDQETDPIDHALLVTGLAGFHTDRVGGIGPIIESSENHRRDLIATWGPMFSLESLFEFSQGAQYDQLVRAREHLRHLRSFSDAVARTSAMTAGCANAFGMAISPYLPDDPPDNAVAALMIGRLEELFGQEQFETVWALLEPELARHQAVQWIVKELPRPLRRFLGIRGAERQQRASTEMVTQLRFRLDEIELNHPELFKTATTQGATDR
jgi:hypothetical protein